MVKPNTSSQHVIGEGVASLEWVARDTPGALCLTILLEEEEAFLGKLLNLYASVSWPMKAGQHYRIKELHESYLRIATATKQEVRLTWCSSLSSHNRLHPSPIPQPKMQAGYICSLL